MTRRAKKIWAIIIGIAFIAFTTASYLFFFKAKFSSLNQVTWEHVAQVDVPSEPVLIRYQQGQTLIYDVSMDALQEQWQERVIESRPDNTVVELSLVERLGQVFVSLDEYGRVKKFTHSPDIDAKAVQLIKKLFFAKQFVGPSQPLIQWEHRETDSGIETIARYTLLSSSKDGLSIKKQTFSSNPIDTTLFDIDSLRWLIVTTRGKANFNLRSEFFQENIPLESTEKVTKVSASQKNAPSIEVLTERVNRLNFEQDEVEAKELFLELVKRMERYPEDIDVVKKLVLSTSERDPYFLHKVTLYTGAITAVHTPRADQALTELASYPQRVFRDQALMGLKQRELSKKAGH